MSVRVDHAICQACKFVCKHLVHFGEGRFVVQGTLLLEKCIK
jgi:hypothetical protein